MPRPRPPFLHREETRHGVVTWYVRRKHGLRIRIRAAFGTDEFGAQYRAAIEGKPAEGTTFTKAKAHTLTWEIDRYRKDSAWTSLSNATRRQRENIFHTIIKTGGDALLQDITRDTIREGRERRADKPHAANNFLKTMRGFFAWCVDRGMVAADPTKGVKLLKGANDAVGFHTWTQDECDRFEARWPLGARERLAYDLLLYTGLRRGDVVRVGRPHVRDGVLTIRTEKSQGEIEVTMPILAPLAASIAATKTGELTYIATAAGRPMVKEGFGNWFADACRAAGCPGSAHGLRKAGATRAANRGASERQLMAVFGWTTGKMAQLYTRTADRRRLAHDAASLMLPEADVGMPTSAQHENEKRPHLSSGAGASAKRRAKSGA